MTQASPDEEHLRLLAIFHYVVGGLIALFACFPLIHLAVGIAMIVSPEIMGQMPEQPSLAFVGAIFATIGGLFFLLGQAIAVCMIVAGRFIQRRTRYLFVFVTACVECIAFPFGTVLGIFTLIVLSRESVKALWAGPCTASPSPPVQRVDPGPDAVP